MKGIKQSILSTLVASMMWLSACTPPTWFATAEGIAVIGVTVTTTLAGSLDPSIQPQAQKVLADFNTIKTDIDAYTKLPTATTLQAVQAGFTVLTGDEDNLLAVFNVSNQKSDTTIKAIITAVDTAVTEIAALIPPATASAMAPGRAGSCRQEGQCQGLEEQGLQEGLQRRHQGRQALQEDLVRV